MEREEMIEKLKNKANITTEEAQEVLEKVNWDIIDAIIYLEREGKLKDSKSTNNLDLSKDEKEYNKEYSHEKKQQDCGIGHILRRFFKCVGKLINKGNINYFEIKKGSEKPIRISLTVSTLLLLIGFWVVIVLLAVGLFLGYKYSIVGPNINEEKVNDIFENASKWAEDLKDDFKEGYNSN